jgi:all-trans-retinol dehydrogenase (NAD+)
VHPSWVRTPLAETLINHPDFHDSVLEPEYVAAEIVKQVLSGRSGQLILPKSLNMLSTLRGWPSWMQESLRDKIAHVLEVLERR